MRENQKCAHGSTFSNGNSREWILPHPFPSLSFSQLNSSRMNYEVVTLPASGISNHQPLTQQHDWHAHPLFTYGWVWIPTHLRSTIWSSLENWKFHSVVCDAMMMRLAKERKIACNFYSFETTFAVKSQLYFRCDLWMWNWNESTNAGAGESVFKTK